MDRRTLTMNWDGLGEDDDDDNFFESRDRLSTAIPFDLASSGSDDDDEFEDSRLSFVSTLSSASIKKFQGIEIEAVSDSFTSMEDYGMWMAEPGDIKERRRRLLQGMGLSSNKDLLKLKSAKIVRAISRKVETSQDSKPPKAEYSPAKELNPEQQPSASQPIVLVRSRSDGDIQYFSVNTKKRKEELIGEISKQRLTRTFSGVLAPSLGICKLAGSVRMSHRKNTSGSSMQNGSDMSSTLSNGNPDVGFASFFLIKNLDTGKEFIVKESNEQGMWNKLSDLQTGKQLTMDEFEKYVGYSPVVKELMRRVNGSRNHDDERKLNANSYLSKSFRNSKRRGVALLKNIKGVAHSMSGKIIDKEREQTAPEEHQKPNKDSSKWIKVRQHGKSYKELTAMHLCQEIRAHEGSIWTIRFSSDARYLATAGEDTLIHIWEVQECEVMNDVHSVVGAASTSPTHPMACSLSTSPVHPIARTNSDDGTSSIKVGEVIAITVEEEDDIAKFKDYQPSTLDATPSPKAPPPPPPPKEEVAEKPVTPSETKVSKPSAPPADRIFASPLARKMAEDHNIPLSNIKGTGPEGRIVKADIEDYLASRGKEAPAAAAKAEASLDYTDIPVSQIRKVTASRLLLSKQTIPHYYLTVDACVDKLMELRSQLNSLQEASGGKKLSVNDLVIKAAALALRKVPQCNSSWTNDYIRQYHNININVAVQTDNGLYVPVVRDADKKGLSTIAEEVKNLAQKAKENSLKPQDYEGGTFTVSNLGGPFGIKQFCAIINPPQSAILAVGSAERRVIPGSGQDQYKFASMMSVTLSCDHRVIDGAIGAQWLKAFKGYIESPESMLL